MEIKLDKDEGRLKKPDDKDKKRDEGHAEEVADEVVKRKREASSPRTYEYLDVTQLYHALHTVVLQSIQRTVLPLHQGHEIRMLVGLIALTGTDFSRGLPQMSGKSVFEHLPDIWMTLAMVYDPPSSQFRVEATVDRLLALLYHVKFTKHTDSRQGMARVLGELKASKISDRTKASLPSEARLETTVRNSNWVLQYWTCERCPAPIGDQFGYAQVKGATRYADEACPA